MTWRAGLLLAALGWGMAAFVARFQSVPGYLDSDYYFAGGMQLAEGKGFTEPYLWNYLDDPSGLPHPSHTYWMPLASIVAAAGMAITGQITYATGRMGFILLAGVVPLVVFGLAYSFTGRRDLALVSGLLSVFSIYYAPSIAVPDNYSAYILLGGAYLLVMRWRAPVSYGLLGLVSGVFTLARSDGVLWLAMTILLIGHRAFGRPRAAQAIADPSADEAVRGRLALGPAFAAGAFAAAGFLVVVGPWFWRTYSVFGALLAPGGGHLLWLTNYDQTFSYPASQLTFGSWLAQGWGPILAARFLALRWNLLNAFAAQGGIFLFPFVLIGIWHYRRDERVQLAVVAWAALLVVMTLVFPFAGYRGGFFHSGAALQALWWTLAPVGLDLVVGLARSRGMFTPAALRVFQASLVILAAILTAVVFTLRVLPGWGKEELAYPHIEAVLKQAGLQAGDVVMVPNPPGYYLMTGQPAIVVPYSDAEQMWAAATRYGARFLVLESGGVTGPMKAVYDNLSSPQFAYLGEVNGTRLFRVQP